MTQATLFALHEWHYPGQVTQVTCSIDGKRVAFGGQAGSIECWGQDGERWQRLSTYDDRGGAEAPPFALSPDGERLAVAGVDRTALQVFLVTSGERIFRLPLRQGKVETIAFSPRGELTVGCDTGWIYVWDAADPQSQQYPYTASYKADITHEQGSPIKAMAWSPDGAILASYEAGDWFLCVYQYHARSWVCTMFHQAGVPVTALAWHPRGKRLAIAYGQEVQVRALQSRAKPRVTCAGGHTEPVTALAWSEDGSRLLSTSTDGVLCLWHAGTGRLVAQTDDGDAFCSLAVMPEGRLLIGRRDWLVQLVDPLLIVGYRRREKVCSRQAWSSVQCAGCLSGGAGREQEVEPIYRLEAGEAMCSTCHTFLSSGRPAPTGHSLSDFFRMDLEELREELSVDGWVYGGCFIAALGLQLWIRGGAPASRAQLAGIEGTRTGLPGVRILDHVVVALEIDGQSYCLDPDGLARQEDFLLEWQRVHSLQDSCLVPVDEERASVEGLLIRPEMSEEIALRLLEIFGLWTNAWLIPFARRSLWAA